VQCGGEAIHHFGHLFARQMTRFFDDLIQCHRPDGKLRRNPAGRNGEFSFPTGCSGFRQKAAFILFPEAMRRSADRRYNCQRAARPFGGASSTSPHISGQVRASQRSALRNLRFHSAQSPVLR
jgi:hypothetical protein